MLQPATGRQRSRSLAMRVPGHTARALEQTRLAVSWPFSFHPNQDPEVNRHPGVGARREAGLSIVVDEDEL